MRAVVTALMAGRIEMDGSADGCGYKETFYDAWQRVSGTVGLVFYIW